MADVPGIPAASINGLPTTRLELHEGRAGVWWIDAELQGDGTLSGPVTVQLLGAELRGTVDPYGAGDFGLQKRLRIVGGKAGWRKLLPKRAHHNDAGVSTREVAQTAADECGETLGTFFPTQDRFAPGGDYVRFAGLPAAATLEMAAGGRRWWVGRDGVTNVGERVAAPAPSGSYTVLSFDGRSNVAEVALDDLRSVGVGSVLSERLVAPITIAAYDLAVTASGARMLAWCPPTDSGPRSTEIGDLLEASIRRVMSEVRVGRYRCRVVQMAAGGRVAVQPIYAVDGLPDLSLCDMSLGIGGAECKLKPQSTCWVEFEAGDIRRPVVTGFEPAKIDVLTLGNGTSGGTEAAGKGDEVECVFGPMPFTATIVGTPTVLQGVITPLTPVIQGKINTGRASVKLRDS